MDNRVEVLRSDRRAKLLERAAEEGRDLTPQEQLMYDHLSKTALECLSSLEKEGRIEQYVPKRAAPRVIRHWGAKKEELVKIDINDPKYFTREQRHKLKKKHGITAEEWGRIYDRQEGLCNICGCVETYINDATQRIQRLCVYTEQETHKKALCCKACCDIIYGASYE